MSAYVKKGGFKKPFVKKDRADRRASDRPATFYKATCSNCGKMCEVPFKPVNGKPVFCRDCFVPTGETATGRASERFAKRDFQPRAFASAPKTADNTEVLKQLEQVNKNLERLIRAVEASSGQDSAK